MRARNLGCFILLSFAVLAITGCNTLKNSAAQDPQKCERDPKCNHKSDKSQDCPTVCADNYDCMQRCEQIAQPNR